MKEETYENLLTVIPAMIEGEDDLITVMSTIACEIFQAFDNVNWAGFYRLVAEDTLKVGPYQGGHGCLAITLDRGVCGKCACEKTIQIVRDVEELPYHIACSSETRSEIVLPILNKDGALIAVFDIDSIEPNSFDEVDATNLEIVCQLI